MALTRRQIGVYTHTQSTPATVWTIAHGLHDYPIVDVFIDIDGDMQKVMPQSVVYVNANTCEITFSDAQSGYATVV